MGAFLSIFNLNGQPVDRRDLDFMLAARPERAVDGQDVWIDGQIALAHQHFWITPEEWNERQPLIDPSGRLVITADARLDNRDELFKLLDLDYFADSQMSDAALILSAYQRWGTACVERFLGDFAFALWDAVEEQLFLARDVLGTRGLCYHINEQYCIAASEVTQILAHPNVKATINEGKIADFLTNLLHDQEESYYRDIFYCPPAHCMVVTSKSVHKWRYWNLDPGARICYKDDRDYADHFLELLNEAVRCRLRTVGPVAISMSGGLDSTMLAAVTSKLLPKTGLEQKQLRSFSYVFDELTSCDERVFIDTVVDRCQLEPSFISGDDKWTLRDIETWPRSLGFVFSDPYVRLPESVYKAAGRAGYRVLLGGYLGDFLFAGARSWAAGMMTDHRFGQLAAHIAKHPGYVDWRRDLLLNGLRHMIPHSLRQLYGRKRTYNFHNNFPGIHPELAQLAESRLRRYFNQQRRFLEGDRWHRWENLTINVPPQGLTATRHRCHRYGVEVVLPYWDRRLVEFVMAVPADQLGRRGRDRWLMRNAAKTMLPEIVAIRRRQTSFTPLMDKGLLKETNTIAQVMQEYHIVEKNYVDGRWLKQSLHNEDSWFDVTKRMFLWRCLSLELWLKTVLSTSQVYQLQGGD